MDSFSFFSEMRISTTSMSQTAQTVPQDFKFPENNKPGETLKIAGTGLDNVKSLTLKAQGKP